MKMLIKKSGFKHLMCDECDFDVGYATVYLGCRSILLCMTCLSKLSDFAEMVSDGRSEQGDLGGI